MMHTRMRWFVLSMIMTALLGAACVKRPVAVIVDPGLEPGIRTSLDQFESDLRKDCLDVIEHVAAFANPEDLRNYLRGVHSETDGRLVGAFLIGNLPHAYQYVTLHSANPNIPSASEEVISFQYYADLDGVFSASPGYVSPGGHAYSYDLHTGDLNWEIWVGVLPMYRGEQEATVSAINRYFEKNHRYRTGLYTIPREFLLISEHASAVTPAEHTATMNALRTGTYAWVPFSSSAGAQIYFASTSAGMTVDQGYAALPLGVADFTAGEAHGWWGGHGHIDIAWAESTPVRTVFFWSDGCAVGNLDHAENFLTAILYSPTSEVLLAKGTTNNSGGMGTNADGFFGRNIATALSIGHRFGKAVLLHVNEPLIPPWSGDREFHYATPVFLGDPTLKLRRP